LKKDSLGGGGTSRTIKKSQKKERGVGGVLFTEERRGKKSTGRDGKPKNRSIVESQKEKVRKGGPVKVGNDKKKTCRGVACPEGVREKKMSIISAKQTQTGRYKKTKKEGRCKQQKKVDEWGWVDGGSKNHWDEGGGGRGIFQKSQEDHNRVIAQEKPDRRRIKKVGKNSKPKGTNTKKKK